MELPGVGPKTADVVLLFSANQPTIPVDTHVNRVSKRLGLAPANGGYEEVRLSLQSLFDPKDYLAVHLLLIAHGRKYCKARQPLCPECPLNTYCPSKTLGDKHD
jgi:endonuclease-3